MPRRWGEILDLCADLELCEAAFECDCEQLQLVEKIEKSVLGRHGEGPMAKRCHGSVLAVVGMQLLLSQLKARYRPMWESALEALGNLVHKGGLGRSLTADVVGGYVQSAVAASLQEKGRSRRMASRQSGARSSRAAQSQHRRHVE